MEANKLLTSVRADFERLERNLNADCARAVKKYGVAATADFLADVAAIRGDLLVLQRKLVDLQSNKSKG